MRTALAAIIVFLSLPAHAKETVNRDGDSPMLVEMTSSVPSPATVGTLVTWTATLAHADDGSFWYRFLVRGSDRATQFFKDFGPDNSFDWAPREREGMYTVEVTVRNRTTGEQRQTIVPYEVTSNTNGTDPLVTPTSHPLVFLYSAPPCPAGDTMTVYFLDPQTGKQQNTPPKSCDGIYSINFYIAGLRGSTFYWVKHVNNHNGALSEGPLLSFTSGALSANLPAVTQWNDPDTSGTQPVLLGATLFTKFVATDLAGNTIWYYPGSLLFLTRPEPGGYFFGIDENHEGDQSRQILREFDLAGMTILETNAARINEQLAAMGKRQIGGFHHEARRLSDGRIVVLATVEQILNDVQGAGPANVVGDMILVLNKDLEVVWTWDGFDHLDARRIASQEDACNHDTCPPLFLAETGNDWLHGNSVAETPDGNLLYSSRSQDWVIKIDYQRGFGSGNVVWRLGEGGDFRAISSDPNPWFSHQHDPEYESDGSLTIFDNGNLRRSNDPNATSRGQVWRIDEANRTAELVLNADLGFYSFALGSAQKLENGNYSFDAGFYSSGLGVTLEVDPSGRVVSSLGSTAPVYRTFRMKDLYTP
jgi:hypothetical protein